MKNKYKFLLAAAAVLILAFTFYEKTFLGQDKTVGALTANSELLVNGAIDNQYLGGASTGYGLGWLYPYNGLSDQFESGSYLTSEELGFLSGYGTDAKWIAVADNEFDRANYMAGNWLHFTNGKKYPIAEVKSDGTYLYVRYEADHILTEQECGRLYYVRVLDADGKLLVNSRMGIYEAQYGLQGKIFRKLLAVVPYKNVYQLFHILTAFASAVVIVWICAGLWKKYEALCAVSFYVVCLFSPWVSGFSSNLYWVMFTWFLPMAFGLMCSLFKDRRCMRWICYLSVFAAVAVKSLCGYEYISTIMMCSITFLMADFMTALVQKEGREKIRQTFRTLFFTGFWALGGFFAALFLHARKRGGGSLWSGLISIYEKDVVRRTYGGDAAVLGDAYAESLNASVTKVLGKYFDFTTPVFTGVTGKLFIPLILLAVLLAVAGLYKKVFRVNEVCALAVLFFASISWFVLGKSHSAAHGHLNFVMWYLGFIQMTVYVIVKGVFRLFVIQRIGRSGYGTKKIVE